MSLARAVKRLVRALIPRPLVTAIVVRRARRHSHRLNAGWGVADLSARLFETLGPSVKAGPFAGLRLPREAAAEHIGPYLLGTYERELHPHWERFLPGTVPLVVNVGAKFGYYAAGLASRLRAPAIAYDADPWAREVLRRTAAINGVAIDVRGRCDRSDLQALPPGTLVVIDCDGCEDALLRAPLPEGLIRSRLVIELHGAMLDDDDTVTRLERTHGVVTIPSMEAPPPPADLPFLSAHERRLAVEEIRTPQRWLICTPLE